MFELFDLLSGKVPGGILLLAMLLLSSTLFFWFLQSSKIISVPQRRKAQITAALVLLLMYVMLWFALRPPLPPQRIVILPITADSEKVELNAEAFTIPAALQTAAINNLQPRYIWHRWEWLLETLGADSARNYRSWLQTAQNMGAHVIIESRQTESNLTFQVSLLKKGQYIPHNRFSISSPAELGELMRFLQSEYEFFLNPLHQNESAEPGHLLAKIDLHLKRFDEVIRRLKGSPHVHDQVLLAAAHLQKGLRMPVDRVRAQYVKVENKEFDQVKRILAPLVQQRQDPAEVGLILGRMALREEEYHKADVYLKKAFIDDPGNCRIHLALSYLLEERLQEIGYNNRIELLRRAVFLDPGFTDTAYELAKEYYESGTGTPVGTGTTLALKTLEEFQKIKSDDPRILSLLASIYLKISRPDDAYALFSKMLEMFPDDSNSYYNMGVVYYQKKEPDKALQYFLKAIEMDQNLDSYLYAGVIYRQSGELEKALEYFRERVKRMTGADDQFAKEAMLGIRTVLKELGIEIPDED